MKNPKFEIRQAKNGQWYFNLIARNGRKILHSELYTTKENAKNGIHSVIENAYESRIKRLKDTKPYFVLEAKNGEIIGVSQTYTTNASREKGIDSVLLNVHLIAERQEPYTDNI